MEASNITWWYDGHNPSFYSPAPFLPSGLSGWRGQQGERSVTRGVAEPGPGQYSALIGRSPGNTGLSLADTADHLLSHLLGSKVHYGLTARPGEYIPLSRVICTFLEDHHLKEWLWDLMNNNSNDNIKMWKWPYPDSCCSQFTEYVPVSIQTQRTSHINHLLQAAAPDCPAPGITRADNLAKF